MSDWRSGYVADIGYTFGYYTELNPIRLKLAFLNQGLVFPEVGAACELGFGQGMSTNLQAAASVSKWYGTDFDPAQAGCAQEIANLSGNNAQLFDESFEEFAQRSDLPDFDFIGLHGIWSWISDENRQIIVDFIRKKLKVGGVLYISYNTLPGWSAFAPIRHLMSEHAQIIGSEGRGIVSRVNDAVEFADKLLQTNPAFSRANPLVGDRIKKLKDQNRHYLAHEYFNRDWHPMHFSKMADWLAPAKVSYACSANYLDHIDAINMTPEQQTFLQEIPDAMFRESVRDFVVNQQFRKDYWVKGPRKMSALDRSEALRAQRVILTTLRTDVSLKVNGAVGEAKMSEAIYDPILDYLADHKIRTLAQIEAHAAKHQISFGQVIQAVMILIGANHLSPVQEDTVIHKAKKHSDLINQTLMNKARSSGDISYLASPVTGGGVFATRFNQLFLLAIGAGRKQPEDWAKFVWEILLIQGQKLIRDNKAIESAEENISELTSQAKVFGEIQLPVLKALQIA
ncbi:MAG: class I SAM-dependent methyltransferase [Pseudohongiella sp.]|nr:class I SAM-dependent methyltransferase [Pseudohongiella sp.]